MYKGQYEIARNESINPTYYMMTLRGDTAALTAPGQFVSLSLPGFFLRRPMSVYDWDGEGFTVVYKPVGQGTEAMTRLQPGAALDVLVGLGNGFSPAEGSKRPLLIGGGSGSAPLYALSGRLTAAGVRPRALLGFNTADEVFGAAAFEALGCEARVFTVDGTAGEKGFVTDAMAAMDYDYFYTCGPLPMYRAIERAARSDGQYSLEERMGCGFGACMGCSIMTKNGPKRVCSDGPVFGRDEIIWPTRA